MEDSKPGAVPPGDDAADFSAPGKAVSPPSADVTPATDGVPAKPVRPPLAITVVHPPAAPAEVPVGKPAEATPSTTQPHEPAAVKKPADKPAASPRAPAPSTATPVAPAATPVAPAVAPEQVASAKPATPKPTMPPVVSPPTRVPAAAGPASAASAAAGVPEPKTSSGTPAPAFPIPEVVPQRPAGPTLGLGTPSYGGGLATRFSGRQLRLAAVSIGLAAACVVAVVLVSVVMSAPSGQARTENASGLAQGAEYRPPTPAVLWTGTPSTSRTATRPTETSTGESTTSAAPTTSARPTTSAPAGPTCRPSQLRRVGNAFVCPSNPTPTSTCETTRRGRVRCQVTTPPVTPTTARPTVTPTPTCDKPANPIQELLGVCKTQTPTKPVDPGNPGDPGNPAGDGQ